MYGSRLWPECSSSIFLPSSNQTFCPRFRINLLSLFDICSIYTGCFYAGNTGIANKSYFASRSQVTNPSSSHCQAHVSWNHCSVNQWSDPWSDLHSIEMSGVYYSSSIRRPVDFLLPFFSETPGINKR